MTMLSPRLEAIAIELCDESLEGLPQAEFNSKAGAILAGLSASEADAAIARATAIKTQEADAYLAEADMLQALQRLTRMPGCPEGKGALPWLVKRGLIAMTPDGGVRVLRKPGPVAT
jgi:hypothetical protein